MQSRAAPYLAGVTQLAGGSYCLFPSWLIRPRQSTSAQVTNDYTSSVDATFECVFGRAGEGYPRSVK